MYKDIPVKIILEAYKKPSYWETITNSTKADLEKLVLKKGEVEGVEANIVLEQHLAYKKILKKAPFLAKEGIIFPYSLNLSQSSSSVSAEYKTRIFARLQNTGVTDLSGGFGIDSFIFYQQFKQGVYCEANDNLCEVVKANRNSLSYSKLEVFSGEWETNFDNHNPKFGVFVDPSRRNEKGERLFDLEQFTPNLKVVFEKAFPKTETLIVKLPPMLDITETLRHTPTPSEIHVVSVKNDCKEILLVFARAGIQKTKWFCSELHPFENTFEWQENDNNLTITSSSSVMDLKKGDKLFIPGVSLNKAQLNPAYAKKKKLSNLGNNLWLAPLDFESGLGKTLELIDSIPFKEAKKTLTNVYYNVWTNSNFPLKASELESKFKIKPGGDLFLLGIKENKKSHLLIARWLKQ
jgi:hypothetical protein